MLIAANPFNVFKFGLTGVFLFLDGLVYWLISVLFALYEALAGAEIVNQSTYQSIVNNFYVIIGVVMLFYVAYSLLKSLINPDEFEKTTSKVALNLVVSLILLGVMPTIFNYAFDFQKIIIEENVIDTLIFGKNGNTVGSAGRKSAFNTLNAFVNPENKAIKNDDNQDWNWFAYEVTRDGGSASFMDLTSFVEPLHEGEDGATYKPLISTLCGCFLVYVLISFCIDLGIRVVKLAFYQIIAPIPILMRIIPEKKSVFDNFVKGSLATYMEVFIRLFIMYIVVFLVSEVTKGNVSLNNSGLGMIGQVVVVLGLFAFAQQAPKLLGDVMGIDSGNIKLGIGGKLAAGGAFGIGAIAGAGITSAVRGGTSRWFNKAGWYNKDGKLTAGSISKNLFHGFGSAVAGGTSGAVRGARSGFSAKTAADMRKAAGDAAAGAADARARRDAYVAASGGVFPSMLEHVKDVGKGALEWTGISAGLAGLKADQAKTNEVKSARKAIDDQLTSILNKYKDSMTTAGGAIDAGFTDSSGRRVTFNNYADLLNEMEVMKSTGKMSDGTTQATAAMLTQISNAEYQLKEQMKKEILEGYDLRNKAGHGVNHKLAGNDFTQFYDAELASLVTDYRTKALQNATIVDAYVDKSIPSIASAMQEYTKQAINNQKDKLEDFISSGNIIGLFENSKDAIGNASGNVDRKVSAKYQQEAAKKGS